MKVKHDDDEWEAAIAAADTWRDPSQRRRAKPTGNLKPLAALFDSLRSDARLPPFVGKLLADLFERHRLKSTTTRTPRYQFSDAEMKEQKYLDCTIEFRQQNFPHGPITKGEMNVAVKELKQRAKAEGRGHREYPGKMAATQLRQERLDEFCVSRGLDRDLFEKVLNGRWGPIRRRGWK